MRQVWWLAIGSVAIAPVALRAQNAPSVLDAKRAQAIIGGCASHAVARKQSHAIVVVDSGGRMVASLRMDGNTYGIFEFAHAKAEAAAAWGFATSAMVENAKSTPGFAAATYVVTVAGGVPVFDKSGARIGAIGVSGEAPADDEACAAAGIRAADLKTSRD